MITLKISCVICIISLCSNQVCAQNIDHFYGGVGVGEASSKIDYNKMSQNLIGSNVSIVNVGTNQQDASYKIFGGFQFNTYLGLEAGYFNLGAFKFNTNTNPAGLINGDVKIDGFNIDLVGTLPITSKFSILGRGGLIDARTRDTFSSSGSAVIATNNAQSKQGDYSAGFGAVYKFSDFVSARAELERYRINDGLGYKANVNLASLSLIFPFGKTAAKPEKNIEHIDTYVQPVSSVNLEEPKMITALPTVPAKAIISDQLRITFAAEVLFGFDRSNITVKGRHALDKFAKEVKNIDYSFATIEGNTDRIGTKRYNDKLSLRRAEAVKKYLISINAIQPSKMVVIGKGNSKPATDSNDCKGVDTSPAVIACLQPDRRVDLDLSGTQLNSK